jgi:hypothetical protein
VAEWLGYEVVKSEKYPEVLLLDKAGEFRRVLPDWVGTSAAFDLLDTLVERTGEEWVLYCDHGAFACYPLGQNASLITYHESKSAAIVTAICQLIDKEEGNVS